MPRSYQDYVLAQSHRHPSLRALCRFFAQDHTKSTCRIVCLEFGTLEAVPSRSVLEVQHLRAFLEDCNSGASDRSLETLGRLLIVEDLNKATVETLGSMLDVNPLFFSHHVHNPKFY